MMSRLNHAYSMNNLKWQFNICVSVQKIVKDHQTSDDQPTSTHIYTNVFFRQILRNSLLILSNIRFFVYVKKKKMKRRNITTTTPD